MLTLMYITFAFEDEFSGIQDFKSQIYLTNIGVPLLFRLKKKSWNSYCNLSAALRLLFLYFSDHSFRIRTRLIIII